MTKIFLGGTCNGSKWRDTLVPLLQIDSFNPVVENWTEECMKRELQERETCDYCLYAITPKMTGVYSIAEVVDDSNKRPQKTILVILEKDEDQSFSPVQLKSLKATAKLVASNGSQVFYSLEEVASKLK